MPVTLVSVMLNSSVPTTSTTTTLTLTNMTCNGLVLVDHSPILESCTLNGILVYPNESYYWYVGSNVGDSGGGYVVSRA